jgi:hypothetical protein
VGLSFLAIPYRSGLFRAGVAGVRYPIVAIRYGTVVYLPGRLRLYAAAAGRKIMITSSVNAATHVGSPKLASIVPWLSRIVLLPPVLIMFVISFRFISNPIHAAAATGVMLSTPEAITDTRVTGALALTLAFIIAASLSSVRSLRRGHLIVMALMAFILGVRLLGFAIDGTTLAMGDQQVKTIGEAVFLTLNTLGWFAQTLALKKTAVHP